MVEALGVLAAFACGLARIHLSANAPSAGLATVRGSACDLSSSVLSNVSSAEVSLRHRTGTSFAWCLSGFRFVEGSLSIPPGPAGKLKTFPAHGQLLQDFST